jgi:hypothetical protein
VIIVAMTNIVTHLKKKKATTKTTNAVHPTIFSTTVLSSHPDAPISAV